MGGRSYIKFVYTNKLSGPIYHEVIGLFTLQFLNEYKYFDHAHLSLHIMSWLTVILRYHIYKVKIVLYKLFKTKLNTKVLSNWVHLQSEFLQFIV